MPVAGYTFSAPTASYCFDQHDGVVIEYILDENAIFLLDEDGTRLEFE